MHIQDLSGREPALPLTLELENGQQLLVEHWLRVLPGQRYVAQAQWQGRTVLAKLCYVLAVYTYSSNSSV